LYTLHSIYYEFELRNYKNFKDNIVIDFGKVGGYQFGTDCIADSTISKMLIYGRNATGKTNLGKAIIDIVKTLTGYSMVNNGTFLNADSEENAALFSYTFKFEDYEVVYKYKRESNSELEEEELLVNEKTIFKCSFGDDKNLICDLDYINAEATIIDRFVKTIEIEDETENYDMQQIPFLRWIINNVALKSDSVLLRVYDYVNNMIMMTVSGSLGVRPRIMYDKFFEYLEDERELKKFEEFLNYMGVECKLALKNLPDGQNELYFKHNKLVPFYENASSGTIALLNIYRRLVFSSKNISFMYLDEFDAFYHYEMAENLVKYFKQKLPNCQIILTTHNTNLMTNRLMRPD